MKIYSITCTRERKLGSVAKGMIHTLSSYGVQVKFLSDQTSIFDAYKKGITFCDAAPDDIIILCHDDLQFIGDKAGFIAALSPCIKKETGIVGPAGTTFLGKEAVWWDHERWQAGYHRGQVQHRNEVNGRTAIHSTNYGPYGQVVALDGLFLAARKEVWDTIGLEKPNYFEGNWDFYDIHYTTTAHLLGYKNYAVPLHVIHQSAGILVGRDSWHTNRKAFIENTELPLTC
jgi:hypothetical protein